MSPEASVPVFVEVAVDYSRRVNFAFQQNAIPVIRRIEIRNHSERDLVDVICRFTPEPEWATEFEQSIALVPAASDYVITDLPVDLNLAYLATLSERVRGGIRLDVTCRGKEDTERESLYATTLPVEVFAFDEWTGIQALPEILAAFVTPNTLVVERLLSRTADLLGIHTDSSALDGYQRKSKKRIYEILECIHEAIHEQKIRYSHPPASFETTGQRVRFGEQILRSKLGTCLDLSLLFASVMEQAGLRPMVLMHEGHMYAGCWLIEDSFPEAVWDDLQSIRKRVDLEEIFVFEATLCCEGNGCDFARTVAAARPHLGKDDIFLYAIDIRRSRASGIRPLPIKREDSAIDVERAVEEALPREREPTVRDDVPWEFRPEVYVDELPQTPEGRIDRWKQQLLDLTLRNRLLNFRETKQTIPLICPHPEQLEDELAASKSFKVMEQTRLMAGLDPRSLALQERQLVEDPIMAHLTDELHARRLRSSLGETELSRRLTELYRRARFSMEESGANTLYLALGFLEWKETKESDRTHRAPILLIPVKMERKSVHQGFSIQRYDEDAMLNVTLLELLKRDFEMEIPGVNPPPEDELGVDAAKVFWLFQQAVKDMPGWEVHREVWIAQFSFSKFLLWKDLNDRVSTLTENRVVGHLVNNPGEPFIDEVENVSERDLDDTVRYDEAFCPVSADSSQLAAIIAASRGKNFVMHGPPGTGKSQTITNLIAHCLAMGKRILFVAEKRAALEVVHKRLSQIGLGPFCLELHSNKTGKADVLNQFGEALDFAHPHSSEEWRAIADRLEQARNELNVFVRELHRAHPNGLTAHHCYAWLIAHRNDERTPRWETRLRIEGIEYQSREEYESLLKLCEDLRIRGDERRLSKAAMEELRLFTATAWTPDWEDDIVAAAEDLTQRIDSFEDAFDTFRETIEVGSIDCDLSILEACVRLGDWLVGSPVLPAEFIQAGDWNTFRKDLIRWIDAGRRRDSAREALTGFDQGAVQALDVETFAKSFEVLSAKGGFLNRIRKHFLLKPVRSIRKPDAPKWKQEAAPDFFAAAHGLQATQALLEKAEAQASERIGEHWQSGEANWDKIEEILDFGNELHDLVSRIAGEDIDLLVNLRNSIARLLPLAADMLAPGKPIAEKIRNLDTKWQELRASEATFRELSSVDDTVPLAAEGFPAELRELIGRLVKFRGDLQNWCRWQESRQQALAAELEPLVSAVEREELLLDDLRFVFDKAYRENLLRRLISTSATLRDFWGDEHQGRINAFKELDEQFTQLTAQMVTARLAAGLPTAASEDGMRNKELGILQRERAKKARHKPLRRLFSEIPGIVPKLKPCFLMSPLSVAQYLDVDQDNFDLVVFDEASQIPVWDAVGAIARGKQVVIVGDPKQLPPTNFFGRTESDEVDFDEGAVQDLESILDECLGSGLETCNLRWHYRSRREGLIAFSNHHYYENRLFTFPSPHGENVGVRLVSVPEGFYDKGQSRTNRGEADAITAEVVHRLKDPVLSRHSIGIVTFSQAQQTLVLDKLDEARRQHPEIEPFFGDEAEEPVFVKNLENVQGDERDVIIFSICYGPDKSGRLSMNFGPLNRSGGERRLNVAVTRAKHEILVFSTLRSEQIDLSRTRARGAEHLKAYLEYAERGPRTLGAGMHAEPENGADVLFESEVADLLREKGYEVHTQVGCSGYRIDLAVVDPKFSGHYLLGIECDGSSYRRAATARDRDHLRQAVLEGLGWKMHRIWSTDWWRDRDRAADDLLQVIERTAGG